MIHLRTSLESQHIASIADLLLQLLRRLALTDLPTGLSRFSTVLTT